MGRRGTIEPKGEQGGKEEKGPERRRIGKRKEKG